MKTGLVMEGGAMRGMFTCGVMDVLLEHGVAFDGAGGISAGAVFGCNYKSRQAGRPIRYNKRFCRDPRYCSFRSLLSTGDLFGADFCYRELPEELDPFDKAAFAQSKIKYLERMEKIEDPKKADTKAFKAKFVCGVRGGISFNHSLAFSRIIPFPAGLRRTTADDRRPDTPAEPLPTRR